MKYKHFFRSAALALLVLLGLYLIFSGSFHRPGLVRDPRVPPQAHFRTAGTQIQVLQEGSWQPFTPRGVNIGTGYPGLFPNETGIDEDTYFRWFTLIGQMNANTIRVYKLQSPAFYSALLRYNQQAPVPLYLIQGVDFPEQLMYSQDNLLDPQVSKSLFRDTLHTVDALHGDHMLLDSRTDRLHVYLADVSPYVLAYSLGIEWDEVFVNFICSIGQEEPLYRGSCLSASDQANPFENFLAQWGDRLLSYETGRYGVQHLLTFANWAITDPLVNHLSFTTNENCQPDREAFVDLEHLHPEEGFRAGLFASYNVYPYYPAFLQSSNYAAYLDENGVRNPYRRYLMALCDHHSMPVVISEFGLPASRTRAYRELWRDFSHGGMSEAQQGQAVASLYQDIRKAGCAGSLVFTWQDEWYKTIWNEKLISDPDRRAFWSNAQCAEQGFGLLAFEPGEEGSTCYPDGDLSDWEGVSPMCTRDGLELSLRQDEKYLYFLIRGLDGSPVSIALDTLPGSGPGSVGQTAFSSGVEFVIRLDPAGSGIYVNEAYDLLPYSALGSHMDTSLFALDRLNQKKYAIDRLPGSPDFLLVSRGDDDLMSHLAETLVINPAGRLTAGNANPDSPDYASNADYCLGDGFAELRIPWQLLGFTDPSQGMIVGDLEKNHHTIVDQQIHRLCAAPYRDGDLLVTLEPWTLRFWNTPRFHERLKQSYYVMQELFGRETP